MVDVYGDMVLLWREIHKKVVFWYVYMNELGLVRKVEFEIDFDLCVFFLVK